MSATHVTRILFMIGALVVVGAFVVVVFISQVFQQTFPKRSAATNAAPSSSGALPYDPLVTVTPKEFLGGTPTVLEDDPQRGNAQAKVTIIEFGDFQCEGCGSMSSVMDRLVEERATDVRHVWKDFPIPAQHPQSEQAAIAARCAYEQNAFWEYHNVLLSRQGEFVLTPWVAWAEELGLNAEQFTTCLGQSAQKEKVIQGYYIARSLDLESTPQYYVNDRLVEGPLTYEELTAIVDEQLANASNQNENE